MTREEKKQARIERAEALIDLLEATQDRLVWFADRLRHNRGLDVDFIHDLQRHLDRAHKKLYQFEIIGE